MLYIVDVIRPFACFCSLRWFAVVCMTLLSCLEARSQSVFSANAVGFVRKTFPIGATAVVNPLEAADHRVSKLLESAPVGVSVYTPGPDGEFETATRGANGWINGDLLLPPGRGFYVENRSGGEFEVIFIGNVLQGARTLALPPGTTLLGSLIPQAGLLSGDLYFPARLGDVAHVFDGSSETANRYEYTAVGWQPHEPVLRVGSAFWLTLGASNYWTRTFSVNDLGGGGNSPGPSYVDLYPLNGGTNAIYSVGGFGSRAISPPRPEIAFVGLGVDGRLRYRVFTEAGRSYTVQASQDLINWSVHTSFTATSAEFHFDAGQPSSACRFYRIVTQ